MVSYRLRNYRWGAAHNVSQNWVAKFSLVIRSDDLAYKRTATQLECIQQSSLIEIFSISLTFSNRST